MCDDLSELKKYIMTDANFTLVQFSKFSIGSVFPTKSGSVSTFKHGYA